MRRDPSLAGEAAPEVAIVMPVFKHSVLVSEAVATALAQETDFPCAVILVNDGCPFPETHAACLEQALAHPGKVFYLHRENGGLSAARNTGVDFALATWPTVKAIYFLDSDNRIRPKAIQKAYEAMLAEPDAGWVYPNIDMFGMAYTCAYPGEYSSLMHLSLNISEAGSLVKREVFASGIRFDEGMRLGYEDWEFWFQALDRGFRGHHLPDFGFLYRKRPESMLADSHRSDSEIRGYMRRKHKALFSPKNLVAVEHAETPRYAVYLSDTGMVALCSDPGRTERQVPLADFEALFWRAVAEPQRYHTPGILACTTTAFLEAVRRLGLLHWLFWQLECGLEAHPFAFAEAGFSPGGKNFAFDDTASGPQQGKIAANLLLARLEAVIDHLRRPDTAAIDSLYGDAPQPSLYRLRLRLPADPGAGLASAAMAYAFLGLYQRLRASPWNTATDGSWIWRICPLHKRFTMHLENRRLAEIEAPLFPMVPEPGQRHIGFILPFAHFGGVEKVALNVACILRHHGYIPHLFVTEVPELAQAQTWLEGFATVNFLGDPEAYYLIDQSEEHYMGALFPVWRRTGKQGKALAMLSWLDGVINAHGAPANDVIGPLKRLGVVTAFHAHVLDQSPMGRVGGHPYLGLAYENAYDLFVCVSRQMADWCHGMGIPGEKIVTVPNAPSYPLLPQTAAAVVDRKRQDDRARPLRVLFLGRLDPQKGLNRLASVVRHIEQSALPVELRVVGGRIMGKEDSQAAVLRPYLEPAAHGAEALTALYAWADVLLLVSRWEGLPLTILEAQRLGVVPVATDVGAVAEAVEDGVTGFLLRGPDVAGQACGVLARLSADRRTLRRVGAAAAAKARAYDWEASCAGLIAALTKRFRSGIKPGPKAPAH